MTDPKPRIPDLEQRLNFIWRQIVDPCDAPLSVWLELMLPALKTLVMEWFAFDVQNMIVAYLRPAKALSVRRGASHFGGYEKGKRGRFREKLGKIVGFDPAEFIGERLPLAEELAGRQVSVGVATLWLIEGIIERVLFWWMVLDLGTEFIYTWMSAVAHTRYCAARDDGVFMGKVPLDFAQGIFGWDPVAWGSPVKMRKIDFYNSFGVQCLHGQGAGIFLFDAQALDLPPPSFIEMRMRCLEGPSKDTVYYARAETTGAESVTLSVSGSIVAGDLWIAEVNANWLYQLNNLVFSLQWVTPDSSIEKGPIP